MMEPCFEQDVDEWVWRAEYGELTTGSTIQQHHHHHHPPHDGLMADLEEQLLEQGVGGAHLTHHGSKPPGDVNQSL
jgi:hypothetical protein